MKNRLFLFLFIGVLVLVFLAFNFLGGKKENVGSGSEIKVTTSFYPLYFITQKIGGDKINLVNLTPPGAEPHDYELTTQDLQRVETSNLLIVNGVHMEPWVDKLTDDLKAKGVKVVIAAENIANRELSDGESYRRDPHVWLDPLLLKEEASSVTVALIEIDPSHQAVYEENAKLLEEELDQLDSEFKQGLANCRQKQVITSHAAFGYIASRYGLTQVSITGISPDEEPSPQKMAEITELVKKNGVKYIFFETLISPRLSETIAKETGAKTLVFNPLEGLTKEEEEKGEDYFSIQRQNLANLKIALECE